MLEQETIILNRFYIILATCA